MGRRSPEFMDAVSNCRDAWGCSFMEAIRHVEQAYPEIRRRAAEAAHERRIAEALLAAWTHPEGTPVVVTLDGGEERETRTRSAPWMICGHPSILLDGISGGYSLERVRAR